MSDTKQPVERINFIVDPAFRQEIKRWRFQNMIETEGEAVRELIRAGLEAKKAQQPAA